jgi:hypothetical protein
MSEQFAGIVSIADGAGNPRVIINGQDGTLLMKDAAGATTVWIDARYGLLDLGGGTNEGDLRIRDQNGEFVFKFNAQNALLDLGGKGNEGDLRLFNDAGDATIHLDGGAGDIKLLGADLAEDFASSVEIEPGTVVVALEVDEVTVADAACDRRVVGIAAGAGGFRPALRLGSRPGEDRIAVAVAGRAYCKADATHGPIELGDLLTSSTTRGHAMRVVDPAAASGAIIGKALGRLEHGTGMIPVLLALR